MPFLNLIPETFAPFKQEAHKIFDETLALFKSHVDDVSLPVGVWRRHLRCALDTDVPA